MIWWNRFKDRGALAVTVFTVTPNDTATLIPMSQYVQETMIISNGANGYIYGQSLSITGITLGANLPNAFPFRIRGPAAYQIGSAGSQLISIYQLLSSSQASIVQNVDTGNILLENGDSLVAENGDRLETEAA